MKFKSCQPPFEFPLFTECFTDSNQIFHAYWSCAVLPLVLFAVGFLLYRHIKRFAVNNNNNNNNDNNNDNDNNNGDNNNTN